MVLDSDCTTAGATPTATPLVFDFNPLLPLAGRVLEVLWALAPAGATITTCNRDLATYALCSAGAIPGALRTLESMGLIERVTSPRGSLIVVLHRSAMSDRRKNASGCDQSCADRPEEAETANPIDEPDRSEDAGEDRSAMTDPPLHPPIRYQHDISQQQLGTLAKNPVYNALRAAGAEPDVARKILEANPNLTIPEFEAMRRAAKRRGASRSPDGIGLVFWCLLHNEPLYSPKERSDGRQNTPGRAKRPADAERRAGRGRRMAPDRPERAPDSPPALTRAYLQSRPRRGDRVRQVQGSGQNAGDGGAGNG